MCEYRITTEDTVRVVYVYELQLNESLRGHGIGQAMLAEAEAAGRARRAKGMMLMVHAALGEHTEGGARVACLACPARPQGLPGPRVRPHEIFVVCCPTPAYPWPLSAAQCRKA